VLPNSKNSVIPIEKLTNYSLDSSKDWNKAEAFRLALGYTVNNADLLVVNIRQSTDKFAAVSKGNNGFGDIYECVMNIVGANGKRANVLTSWIIESGTDYPRMTNVYVTKKKVR